MERARAKTGNKGWMAALEMVNLLASVDGMSDR